ncbi:hypothetical protein LSCM1_03387 [Leishmania martiniquensis]|uniref:Uncharacterized protein n=1 Tax=Leishmania martiniquensis TaxID=1580590 RepID=A0A836H0F3_9TRYP|nr:hypothetical protein LSCM1_03387 [Leishmania martiniquensis]
MTDVTSSRRPSSRQGSPVPRRQLGMLPANQRSYSRVGSKCTLGDDSPLMSPLPYYPRRRSVTFAGDQSLREERPNYNAAYSASAPVSPVRDGSPPPVSILKPHSSFPAPEEEDSGAAPALQAAAATVRGVFDRRDPMRNSPVPVRGRSTSRQRLAARRKEAQLHRSFYDDSFVEEYVLRAKTELDKEEAEQRRMQEQLRAEQERAKRAERRVSEATEKINALQHAKEVLMAATVRRHPSETPSPPRAPPEKSKRNSSLLRELEADPDPEVQAALKELARNTVAKQRSRARPSTNQRHRSISIVSADALAGMDEVDYGDDDDAIRKRARLEKIVSTLLAKKAKSKSKCSVMVIDWSDVDSDADGGTSRLEEDRKETAAGLKRQRGRPVKSRSPALRAETSLVRSAKTTQKVSAKCAASSRKPLLSAEPELGDSLLFEDEAEQPILLPRRQHTLPAPTRSISHIDTEGDDDSLRDAYSVERLVRRPPRATRASAPRQPRGRPASAHPRRGAEDVSLLTAGPHSRGRAPQPPVATAGAPNSAPPRRRRGSALRADPNDPMAVFFEAAFPSPSKFDEMMMQAGGLPETRRGGGGGRGQGRHPNLVLPSSIGRRR